MGCASSKQSRCRHCQTPYSPIVPRSYSMHVHHPPQRTGDSYHVVALTSTTLGSINVGDDEEYKKKCNESGNHDRSNIEFSSIEAKTWSDMMKEKIPKIVPKTPIRTPPGEPETINTWELMEGLEDISPLRPLNHLRSFSFDVVSHSHIPPPFNPSKSKLHENGTASPQPKPKPLWLHMVDNDSNSNSVVSDFDPDVISTFRKALEELSPANPFHLRPLDENEKQPPTACTNHSLEDTEEKKVNGVVAAYKCPPRGKDKVVIYFTSLRGVRRTYEECCQVRVILKGLGVRVDERDVSMHSGFKEELKEVLGDEWFNGGGLPRVFAGGKYIGGAEEVRRMHEEGQLEKVLEGCEMVDADDGGGGVGVCEACGDIRFVPCERCSGSCKIYYEDEDDDDEGEGDDEECGEYGFQRCPDCNENGIVRCPICCY